MKEDLPSVGTETDKLDGHNQDLSEGAVKQENDLASVQGDVIKPIELVSTTEQVYHVKIVDDPELSIQMLIPFLLAFIGWMVIYNNAKKLSTRAETKALIDDAVSMVEGLDSLVVSYWLKSGVSGAREFELLTNAKLNILNERIKLIASRGLDTKNLSLSDMATLALVDCELVDERKKQDNVTQAQLYLDASSQLISLLYDNFQKCYKPSKVVSSIKNK
jgi:hypothetical protein